MIDAVALASEDSRFWGAAYLKANIERNRNPLWAVAETQLLSLRPPIII